jgi:carbonic anhydrase/acetyltransferase-like protein (isoleucine patch superfamily)
MTQLISYKGKMPVLDSDVYVAPGAILVGDVVLGEGTSVWMNCVLRGDTNFIRVGKKTNIQDLTVVHVAADIMSTHIGSYVTIGHRAIVHACTIEDACLIGMGAIIMDRAVVGQGSLVAAGALVPEGMVIPPGYVVMGAPAKIKRPVHEAEREWIHQSAENYYQLAKTYLGS